MSDCNALPALPPDPRPRFPRELFESPSFIDRAFAFEGASMQPFIQEANAWLATLPPLPSFLEWSISLKAIEGEPLTETTDRIVYRWEATPVVIAGNPYLPIDGDG
jgi:hypothetical protein